MLKRLGSTVFAAGLIVFALAPALGQEAQPPRITDDQNERERTEADPPEQSQIEEEAAVPIEAVNADAATEHAEADNRERKDQEPAEAIIEWPPRFEANDSLAQWIMAFFGIIATFVSVWAVILLKRTLKATRDAVGKAAEAAEAAHEANSNFMKIAVIETRAYLAVEPLGIRQLIKSDDFLGHVEVKNVGKLPARNVSLYVRMERSEGPEPEHSDRRTLFEVPTRGGSTERVIHPGGTMQQGSKDRLAVSEVCHRQWHEHNIYVWGVVHYEDGHGCSRFTQFCHRYAAASFDRSQDLDRRPTESRPIITSDKARYHACGNNAD